jgi:hypothetical protein
MYSASESLTVGTGRDWANLMELELSQGSGQHPLFSFRELDLPIVGVYYGFFGREQTSLLFPPTTAALAKNASLLRLLGVRYIVSSHATLADSSDASADFTLLGVCAVGQGPTEIRGEKFDPAVAAPLSGAGLSYVYEVTRAPGIFSLACEDVVMSQERALSETSRLSNTAWEKGVVWTEKPLANATTMSCGEPMSSQVQVLSEDGSDVHLRVDADRSLALVASYAYRPGWSASIDGHEVAVSRAYGGLLAIAVPKGFHTIVFSYRSSSLSIGLATFALSAIVLLVGSRRSRHRAPSAELLIVDLDDSETAPAHDLP